MSSKISGLAALSSTQADDVLPVVDVHDTTMAASGTTKKITVANLLAGADAAGAAAAAAAASLPLAGGTMSGAIAMGSHKVTGLTNGSAGSDAAAYGQTLAGGSTSAPSGIAPSTSGFTSFATGGAANLLNTSSGTSTGPVAGTFYYAFLYIPFNVPLTGIILTTGTAAGTDKWIVALWSGSGGTALANSATAGTNVTASTNVRQAFPFTGTVAVTGPGTYIVGVQSNGTTAKFLSFPAALEGFTTGSVAGSFGTVPSLTPASTYTAGMGPFATTY